MTLDWAVWPLLLLWSALSPFVAGARNNLESIRRPTLPQSGTTVLDAQGLAWVRQAYLVSLIGGFVFLFVLEGGSPAPSYRLKHVLRNVGLFALVLLVADGLVLGLLFHTPVRLAESHGLLSPLALSPLTVYFFGFILLDLFAYWYHRLSHRVGWLWRFHAVHHSDPHVDASTSLRSHPLEVSLSVVCIMSLCQWLGIPLWVEGARAVIANPWAMFQHASLPRSGWLERSWGWLLATPAIHLVHHSTDIKEMNSNYGVVFSCWDRLFGTYLKPKEPAPRSYGLTGLLGDSWQSMTGMLLTPIRIKTRDTPREP
jgi:sterol desaturase/sphingolipid hydroxylase (fatty acid hydroxylase superfamily)